MHAADHKFQIMIIRYAAEREKIWAIFLLFMICGEKERTKNPFLFSAKWEYACC